MAGTHPLLAKLRAALRTLDDDALAALANKGLLRRAQKDLAAAQPLVVAIDEDAISLAVGDATVTVPPLPTQSSCTCPASGVCRHVLAALVYLRDDPELKAADPAVQRELFDVAAEEPAEPEEDLELASPLDILANVTDEELQKWAGKAIFRRAQKALVGRPKVEIDTSTSLVVRFPDRNITCRWVPGGGLVGMVCSCQAETVCEHVVTALLAYQASLGQRSLAVEATPLRESAGAPRTRSEVLASVHATLTDMVGLGLARLSAATSQRLTTLAVSAHGVDLPRLERLLRGLADEVELSLRRDAQSSSTRLLARAAQTEALATALDGHSTAALVGEHRTEYYNVGEINLIGVGAQRWRSQTGYQGLTVYFWDESREAWATWTDARPAQLAGFDPLARYRADGPWSGCPSPQKASRSTLKLRGAWRNLQGRLSGRASTQALITGTCQPTEFPSAFNDWSQLMAAARRYFSTGLADRDASSQYALLMPGDWEAGHYDPVRQELVRPIRDGQGRAVLLWLPFSAENQGAIERLETLDPADVRGVFGALRLVAGAVRIQPISLVTDDTIENLNLDDAKSAAPGGKTASPAPSGDEEEDLLDEADLELPAVASTTALGRLLISAQAEIEAVAEGGVAARRDVNLLKTAAERLDGLGLVACGRPLARLCTALGPSAARDDAAARRQTVERLLHVYYVLQVACDQDAIATACGGIA